MGILISTETCCLLTLSYLITGPLISRGNLVSFTNKTDRHDITEILLKVVLNTITLTPYSIFFTNAIFFYIYISNQISTTFDKIKILYFFNVSTHFFFNYYCLTTYGWLVLWCLTPVLLVMEPGYPEKISDLPDVIGIEPSNIRYVFCSTNKLRFFFDTEQKS